MLRMGLGLTISKSDLKKIQFEQVVEHKNIASKIKAINELDTAIA